MHRFIFIVLGMAMGAASATPGPFTLTWSAQESGSALCLANGTPLAVGQKVRLGYFDISQEEVQSNFTQPMMLAAHFHSLAETDIGSFESQTFVGFPELSTSGVNFPEAFGSFASSIIFAPSTESTEMDGQRCYVWAMDSATVEASNEHGIFSHDSWVLELNTFGSSQWDLGQVTSTNPADILLGSRGPQVSLEVGGTVLRLTNTSQLLLDQQDNDHDGVSALLENAFAMDPATPDSSQLPQITLRSGKPSLEFQRKSGGLISADGSYVADSLRYVVEISEDLHDWRPYDANSPAVLSISPGTSPGLELVSINLNPGAEATSARFARVRIERNP